VNVTDTTALPSRAEVSRVATWNLDSNPQFAAERMLAAAAELVEVEILLVQENQLLPDERSAVSLIAETAGFGFVFERDERTGTMPGTAILSRHPFVFTETIDYEETLRFLDPSGSEKAPPLETTPDSNATTGPAAVETTSGKSVRGIPPRPIVIPAMLAGIDHPSGRRLVVVSAHLAWGALAEPVRLRQAETIARRLDDLSGFGSGSADPLGIVGMDANTLPASATIRFLTGLDPLGSYATLFVDTFAVAGSGAGATSTSHNPYAARTAAQVGILRADLLPDRRIDYLLARGYVHGRPGFPLASGLLGADAAFTPSDHYGVWSDLWLPPVP
jgi:endonuclease/exonuclease/phosphatase family metal-dependent hydrolase